MIVYLQNLSPTLCESSNTATRHARAPLDLDGCLRKPWVEEKYTIGIEHSSRFPCPILGIISNPYDVASQDET